VAGLGLSGTGLRHRWYRRILVYQSRRWILSLAGVFVWTGERR
jgi:hypothetical protein